MYQPRTRHDLLAVLRDRCPSAHRAGVRALDAAADGLGTVAAFAVALLVFALACTGVVLLAVLTPRVPARGRRDEEATDGPTQPESVPERSCASLATVATVTGEFPSENADEPMILPYRLSLPVVRLTLPLPCVTDDPFRPLTPEEAEAALDDAGADAVPFSEERIKEMVEYATGGPEREALEALLEKIMRPSARDTRPAGPRRPPKPAKPKGPPKGMGVAELRRLAASRGVRGTRTMRRAELLAVLEREGAA